MKTLGSCFKDALKAANVLVSSNLSIPDWVQIEEISVICGYLNLEWYGVGKVEIGIGEPIIVLYQTSKYKSHAVFISDVGPLLGCIDIIGLIRLTKGTR